MAHNTRLQAQNEQNEQVETSTAGREDFDTLQATMNQMMRTMNEINGKLGAIENRMENLENRVGGLENRGRDEARRENHHRGQGVPNRGDEFVRRGEEPRVYRRDHEPYGGYREHEGQNYHHPYRGNERGRDDVEDGKLKHTIPEFLGDSNPETFLEWLDQVELIFQLHNYSEAYQVKLVVAAFRGYALTWWKDLSKRRKKGGEPPITSWQHLRNVMRASYVPKSHTTFLRKELQGLKQGVKSVAEYYHEMKRLMLRLDIEEEEAEMEVRFVEGLHMGLRHKVELESLRTDSLEELNKYALTIEQQMKEESWSRGKYKATYSIPGARPVTNRAFSAPTGQPLHRQPQYLTNTGSSVPNTPGT